MKRKILIAAGGTGGHLYPAIALAKQLTIENSAIDILFAAGGLSTNRFFKDCGFKFRSVEAAAVIKKSFWQFLKSCKALAQGIWQSRQILAEYKPELVVGFGSYHSFPVLFAAQCGRYPFILHEQNSQPGRVIRYFAKNSLLTGVYFPPAMSALPCQAIELAMPLREGYCLNATSKAESYRYFNMHPAKKTVLAFGGSQGARFINESICKALIEQPHRDFQLLHFTGEQAATTQLQAYYQQLGVPACVKTFEPHMKFAWSIADLVISRAGASTIAEQIEFEVPAIFIPYPHAAENHQEGNAAFVVNTVKGGWKYSQTDFNVSHFSTTLTSLLLPSSALLNEKKQNLALYKQKTSRRQFSTLVQELLASL